MKEHVTVEVKGAGKIKTFAVSHQVDNPNKRYEIEATEEKSGH